MKPCKTCKHRRDHVYATDKPSGKSLCAVKAAGNYVGVILKNLDGCNEHARKAKP